MERRKKLIDHDHDGLVGCLDLDPPQHHHSLFVDWSFWFFFFFWWFAQRGDAPCLSLAPPKCMSYSFTASSCTAAAATTYSRLCTTTLQHTQINVCTLHHSLLLACVCFVGRSRRRLSSVSSCSFGPTGQVGRSFNFQQKWFFFFSWKTQPAGHSRTGTTGNNTGNTPQQSILLSVCPPIPG